MNKPRLIFASALAAITTIVFVVVITVWAELSIPLKNWLKSFSGHHWTSKSIFSALLYAVATTIFYGSFRNPSEIIIRKLLVFLLVFMVLGILSITAFFTGHYLGFF
ncbi:MAG: hypothetical protein A3I26_01645 [Candidatus Yanofskybacteria bacterium RIFCSPLOWO2_02_FULL_43_10]|uniref:Uncharacterized protein n=1 Tax=Candidatus Yanofskybacteria bacterium RIFCSPLOWO2_12_FULL_43_11b TaxID=1802710 RepID=A0A1F8H8V7_9BACT|nr:MAG: hypothetical protein A2742_00955 [Candidatus Yanofskybacteria bacterium RIFCSPHIGHO2_01_FULL_43_32]OGN11916.1 MAG: hypothetical protein A3C69_02500 [Candidatus Yanofskybacteria bacterium RIFCSPHIGHO2_02_FULL_43_12]OGN24325.1 MAG: hypothetical protein A2923_00195 [Candidatus Yanofskybacteria bacterium RIFCSPLOWO2_01_FULL_43_46]OGN29463.1 MAG: hypothetical protein A3I26_01645 [Candidatus Yanofskybacteria bacterium RIFCSPLOWO2_02_FULL_43_10]OGN33630.1 MAG: hypothetical protein A3G51_01190 